MSETKQGDIRKILYEFTHDELCEIYTNLNKWEWDGRIGEKPDGFDSMKRYNVGRTYNDSETKFQYIRLYILAIERIIPKHDLLEYHHIHNLGKTSLEFEMWWKNNYGFADTSIRSRSRKLDLLKSVVISVLVSVIASLLVVSLFQ